MEHKMVVYLCNNKGIVAEIKVRSMEKIDAVGYCHSDLFVVVEVVRGENEGFHVIQPKKKVEEKGATKEEEENLCSTCVNMNNCAVVATAEDRLVSITRCDRYEKWVEKKKEENGEFEIISIRNSGYSFHKLAELAGGSLVVYEDMWLAVYEGTVVGKCMCGFDTTPAEKEELIRRIAKKAGCYVHNQDAIRVKKA
jgi:prenyltransferase beta subunit